MTTNNPNQPRSISINARNGKVLIYEDGNEILDVRIQGYQNAFVWFVDYCNLKSNNSKMKDTFIDADDGYIIIDDNEKPDPQFDKWHGQVACGKHYEAVMDALHKGGFTGDNAMNMSVRKIYDEAHRLLKEFQSNQGVAK